MEIRITVVGKKNGSTRAATICPRSLVVRSAKRERSSSTLNTITNATNLPLHSLENSDSTADIHVQCPP